jgi:hypothetical protein
VSYNPEIHHRRSIRLKDYDYTQEGAYFITICTKDKQCIFGDIKQGEMKLNLLFISDFDCTITAVHFFHLLHTKNDRIYDRKRKEYDSITVPNDKVDYLFNNLNNIK